MVYWHWNITRDGAIRFSLILLLFSFSYQNFTWLNSYFLPLIPVGYILLGISSVFVLRHIYRTIRWYRVWLNGKRHQKYEKLAIHICLYLVIMSVILSIPISIDDSPTTISTDADDDGTFKYSVEGNGYIIGISNIITNVHEKDIDSEVELDVIKVGIVNMQDNPMKYANFNAYALDKDYKQYEMYRPIRITDSKYPYMISGHSSAIISPSAVEYFYIPFNHRMSNMEIINFEIIYMSDYKTYTESVQINLNEPLIV